MGCTHNCESCSSTCSSQNKESLIEKPQEGTKVKKIIGIVSGKGGVGKSLVTSMLAVCANKKGYKSAILDADVTGPSIPKAFGITEKAQGDGTVLRPTYSTGGVAMMSTNLLLPSDTDPVIWRGPIIAGMVKQFWTEVVWGEVDFMFVDMPPGTGDVPLTVFQSLPLDGIVIVSTPQDLVSMIVKKAANMANMMNVPILGMVENMSYLTCPDCGKKIDIFGESKIDEIAAEYGVTQVIKLPIDPATAAFVDGGAVEVADVSAFDGLIDCLAK